MGLFGKIINSIKESSEKEKARLLEWQNFISESPSDTLTMNENQLKEISQMVASGDLKIIQDSIKIVNKTIKPDVFFSRLDLLKEKAKQLKELEKFINFDSSSPSEAFDQIILQEQNMIHDFLERYFLSVLKKAESLKTEKGQLNQFQKFYDSSRLYFDKMDDRNIGYVRYKYSEHGLKEQLYAYIKRNKEVMQTELYEHFDIILKNEIQRILQVWDKEGRIKREKSGRTYKITI